MAEVCHRRLPAYILPPYILFIFFLFLTYMTCFFDYCFECLREVTEVWQRKPELFS